MLDIILFLTDTFLIKFFEGVVWSDKNDSWKWYDKTDLVKFFFLSKFWKLKKVWAA